jgi:hypothetical protein
VIVDRSEPGKAVALAAFDAAHPALRKALTDPMSSSWWARDAVRLARAIEAAHYELDVATRGARRTVVGKPPWEPDDEDEPASPEPEVTRRVKVAEGGDHLRALRLAAGVNMATVAVAISERTGRKPTGVRVDLSKFERGKGSMWADEVEIARRFLLASGPSEA